MSVRLAYTQELETITCCSCGVEFGVPCYLKKKLLETHKRFYCPNGHEQAFLGETEAERLKKELEKQKERTRWAEEENKKVTKKLKRTEKRISCGVCPCCNRSFVNLQRHMKTKHKDYVK